MLSYYPVMVGMGVGMEITSVVARAMARFKKLNGVEVHYYSEKDFATPPVCPNFAKAWIWDLVPESVERILYMDIDTVPVRPIDEIPDVAFAAAHDVAWGAARAAEAWPVLGKQGNFFFSNGIFLAHRSTRESFERIKFHQTSQRDQIQLFDCSVFNLILHYDHDVKMLPPEWNAQIVNDAYGTDVALPDDPIFIHLAGGLTIKWALMRYLIDLLNSKEDPFKVAKMMSDMQIQLKELTGA